MDVAVGSTTLTVLVTNVGYPGNMIVAAAYYQLNSGGWTLANGTTNWSATNLTLVAGTNVVQAFAVDTSENYSLTNSMTFTH